MGVDRRMWKMNPERLQEHLQLKNRARQIPDKKKQQNKRACRDNSRRASRISGVAVGSSLVWVFPLTGDFLTGDFTRSTSIGAELIS
ncbi:hypothetical protein N24_1434 [Corynebacterium suranareeae]|uniref:Uncharacterized protein n=1 Tax=Corynebacterium suranareeae TaxID=2506452 RepID=A0A160PQ59_9CORY|nr:hypothetical protein N24_1434 [Corynebacterium suranareeae]